MAAAGTGAWLAVAALSWGDKARGGPAGVELELERPAPGRGRWPGVTRPRHGQAGPAAGLDDGWMDVLDVDDGRTGALERGELRAASSWAARARPRAGAARLID